MQQRCAQLSISASSLFSNRSSTCSFSGTTNVIVSVTVGLSTVSLMTNRSLVTLLVSWSCSWYTGSSVRVRSLVASTTRSNRFSPSLYGEYSFSLRLTSSTSASSSSTSTSTHTSPPAGIVSVLGIGAPSTYNPRTCGHKLSEARARRPEGSWGSGSGSSSGSDGFKGS
eukprot:3936109-Rhodomonas_salina.2